MGERLIKPYEISVWEDKLTQNGLEEIKLAVIGSDTMSGPNKVYEPVFTKKVNGEKTLTFSLKYKYFDPSTGNENVVNPFAALLVNERKVKLHYDNQWYEFIVKDHSESSDEYTWTYTCVDAFVLELSKNGYNIEFNTELNNNQGTARELAEATLEGTDWRVGNVNVGRQLIAEPIYKAVINGTINVLNTDLPTDITNEDATQQNPREITYDNQDIYVFYSYVKNKNGKFVQFIIRDDNRQYTIDDKNVITDTNYRITTELTFEDDGFYFNNTKIISIGNIDKLYQANRLVYAQCNTYDPVMQRTVNCYTVGDDGREVYGYTDYTYTTSNVIMNFIANGDNFNALEEGTIQGWNPYVDSEDNEAITKLELVTKPELEDGKPLADLETLSQIEGFLKVNFIGALTNNYENAIFNDGIQGNTAFINSIAKGDEFVFRWRAGYGDIQNLQPTQTLGLLVARYTRDTPQRWGRYYYHIDTSDIILNISGTPAELNNIVEGGHIEDIVDEETHEVISQIYVIDTVAQNVSTKYLYKDGETLYYWDGQTSRFKAKDLSYLPYYYLTGQAEKAIPNSVLTDSTIKYGIFIYTTSVETETIVDEDTQETYTENLPVYIQDIQLTRCVRDGNNVPVIIGNVPTATSKPTEYYYLKPSDSTAAEDVETYTSLEDLQQALGTLETIKPVYNEDSEKYLSISASQSNCFNILQLIAETFECWIDLVVDHDVNGYITYTDGKPNKFVYLREYVGKDNWAGFKYGINLQSIERTINSEEIVTKLIVDQSQSEYVDEGYISIANSPSNPSGESYILNFDYYYNQGLLNREEVENDKTTFIEAVKDINLQLQDKEKLRRDLETSLNDLGSKRNVYTELIDSAQDAQTEALEKFEYLTHESYEDYKDWYNTYLNADTTNLTEEEIEELDKKAELFEEENVLDALGMLYTSSAVINNYSGILSNIETEYWNVRQQLHGSENYKVKVWVDTDELDERHVFVELNDYLLGFEFTIGTDSYESTVSKKYFDIVTNATTITFTAPTGYTIEENSYIINDNLVANFQITANNAATGVEDEIEALFAQKEELVNAFNNKYSRFIQEGTWNSTDYIDAELYYLDALQVSNTSAQPTVSYTINVVEISQLEGLGDYLFDAGDKTYVEDTEFFGWSNVNGILTPAREEVIVSEVEWHLDEPENNIITVQNYKTRFEDLFQRISAAVQTVQYNEATYAKISSLMDANGTINSDVLLQSLQQIAGRQYNLTSDGSVIIKGDHILVQNLNNTQNHVIINSEGIRISSNGGATYTTAIDGRGINIGTVYTGKLNTDQVIIGSEQNPSFRWDKSGISAYKLGNDDIYDLQTYVRYDQYGLYGIKNNSTFKAQSLQDVLDKAHFAVTWDGFFIKNSYEGGGRVEITSDNDFRVLKTEDVEKIKIGALEWEDENGDITTDPAQGVGAPTLYGIRIKNDAGAEVMKTDDQGNIEITGTVNANAGIFDGLVQVGTGTPYIAIDGENAVIKSSLYSQDGASYGWMINAEGDAVFNNITARGAIKTAVFEYAEIQAVGGVFIFRPSSTIRSATVSGNDLILTVEKPILFKEDDWCKISNYTSGGEANNPDVDIDDQNESAQNILQNNGLSHVYQISDITSSGGQTYITLEGAAAMVGNNGVVANSVELIGGALVDMGNDAGTSNYGIGINSSDNSVNLPARAISLFETEVDDTKNIKVSYKYRGILGTLPYMTSGVDSRIYQYMQGTQGIYTDNMYLGDNNQYIAFYTDSNNNKQLKIKANQIVYEINDTTGEEITWNEYIDEQIPIRVEIESVNGNLFYARTINTILICTVYKGNTDITNQVTSFTWQKKDKNGNIDENWTPPLGTGRQLEITNADVDSKAIFTCTVQF